jgi:diketogulonate reductase-like aldo/keto reductase
MPGPAFTRAELLRLAGAAGLALSLPGSARPQEMRMLTRPIPSSGEALPVVGLGTWQTFDIGADEAERAQRRRVLEVLLAAGGKVIDSSPMYGRSEAVVGDLLAAMGGHDRAFLATKVWTSGEQAGRGQMQQSFDRLRTRRMDLMQVHNLVDWRTQLSTMRKWQAEGRIRYLGITHYTVPALDELARIIRAEKLDFVQLGLSLATREAEQRLLPLAAERGVAVIANQPFDSGTMFARVKGRPLPGWAAEIGCASWGQIFLKYLISNPALTCVIPGTAKPEHMQDNVAAGSGPLPDARQRKAIVDYWQAT